MHRESKQQGFSLLEVVVALTILSVMFLGVTDLVLSGKRVSGLARDRLAATLYADSVVDILENNSCSDLESAVSGNITPDYLLLAYDETPNNIGLQRNVKLTSAGPSLYRAEIKILSAKGSPLASRSALLTCMERP